MLNHLVSGVRKLAEIVFQPGQIWRSEIFAVRRAIDANESNGVDTLNVAKLLDRLIRRSADVPEALRPTVRQLRRVGRTAEGLDLVEKLWDDGRVESARIALGCAMVWYDEKKQRRGDAAIDRAKELDPTWKPIYEEEAHNQRWRGNASAALEAADVALRLSRSRKESMQWTMFVGELQFELGHFEKAITLMLQGMPERPSAEQQYMLGLALQLAGRNEEANERFAALELDQSVPVELRVGILHYTRKNYFAAISAVNEAPDSPEKEELQARAHLMLGQPELALEVTSPEPEGNSLAEVRALANELAGNNCEAGAEYTAIFRKFGTDQLSRRILRRAARAAYLAGDYATSVRIELERTQVSLPITDLEAEVLSDYMLWAEKANVAILNGHYEVATQLLLKIAYSSSQKRNSRHAYRTLGYCLAKLGKEKEAADAYFSATRFPLAHADELLQKCRENFLGEQYSEFWETLPLRSDVILYETFHGASTSCNPLSICLRLLEDESGEEVKQHVWVLNEGATPHPELRGRKNVHFVTRDSWGYYLHLATAKFLVNNTTFPPRFLRKPGQTYVNTWHGTPWKHLGRDIAEDPFSHENAGRNFLQATHLLMPNQHTAETLVRTHDVSNLLMSEPIVIGSPRIDRTIGLNSERRAAISDQLGIDADFPVIFYAPTWRGALGALQLDPTPFLEAVQILASRNAKVLVRFHHLLTRAIDPDMLPDNVTLVPESVDTNEVLALTDVLVSDYSSLIFDFVPRNRPIIKYVFDLDAYTAERGLYFSIDEVPGVVCRDQAELGGTTDELLAAPSFEQDWSQFSLSPIWSSDDGKASRRAIEAMFGAEEPPLRSQPRTVMINLSGLRANGVTRSARNLMSSIKDRPFEVQLMLPKASLDTRQARDIATELHRNGNISLYTGLLVGTRQETVAWRLLQDIGTPFPAEALRWVRSRMQRERRRYFAEANFESVFDFDGYVAAQAGLVALGFSTTTRSVYVAHSEFVPEMYARFPKHRQLGAFLGEFTAIASVSDGAMHRNRDDMHAEFGVPATLHTTMPNTLDIEGILEQSRAQLDGDLVAWFARPEINVIIVARLSVEKNQATVIRALAQLRDRGMDLDLTLLGSGPKRKNLEQLTRDLGLDDRVMFAGHRDNPYPAIAHADAMLLPSTHEGQGLVLFEGILLGLPVAASNITGPASVLAGGKHGMLVSPDVAGMVSALQAIATQSIPKPDLDVTDYQAGAVGAFFDLAGR